MYLKLERKFYSPEYIIWTYRTRCLRVYHRVMLDIGSVRALSRVLYFLFCLRGGTAFSIRCEIYKKKYAKLSRGIEELEFLIFFFPSLCLCMGFRRKMVLPIGSFHKCSWSLDVKMKIRSLWSRTFSKTLNVIRNTLLLPDLFYWRND